MLASSPSRLGDRPRRRMPAARAVTFLCVAASSLSAQTIGNFPNVAFPPGNPSSPEKIELGKALFFEEQLSSDNTMACATCHLPEAGGADPREPTRTPGDDGQLGTLDDEFGSKGMVRQDVHRRYAHHPLLGLERQATNRNAPTVIGAAFFSSVFWDMRAGPVFRDLAGNVVLGQNAALETQAVAPPVSSIEMGHEGIDWARVTDKLAGVRPLALASDLPPALAAFLGDASSYAPLFARAFGSSDVTRERVAMAIATYERTLVPDQAPFDLGTMTPLQRVGEALFLTRGNCFICHTGALFSDGFLHTINLPGHFRFTKTPTLRNIGLQRQITSSGQFTLDQVITHYEDLFFFQPPRLNVNERRAILAFLGEGLTDPRVAQRLPPFDRPTLASERAPFGSNRFGRGSPGTGGIEPELIAHAPANLGNERFVIGVGRARGGAGAILALSRAPLPAEISIRGVPVWIDLHGAAFEVFTIPDAALGQGIATLLFPIPNDLALIGQSRFAQAYVLDPNAAGGIAATAAASFTVFTRLEPAPGTDV